MFILKLLLLIFILGIIILVHEFGHFIWAKKFGVHIYEFSIGMGPVLYSRKGKDKIIYNLRWIPIGGFVSMAGEVYDDDEKIPKKKLLCNKPWWQRVIILAAGVINNFILAIVLLTLYAFIWSPGTVKPVISDVLENSAAEKAGIKEKDEILSINDYKITNWDKAQIILYYKNDNSYYTFDVKHADGSKETIKVTPDVVKDEEGNESNVFGIALQASENPSFTERLTYGVTKFASVMDSMTFTIWGLISGKINLDSLSGPVGIYSVVGESFSFKFSEAIAYIVYLLAFLSINVGYINILPFPAFDGGHILFLLIEVIRGKKLNAKIENICHLIGFGLIFLLMIIVTINDIIKLL